VDMADISPISECVLIRTKAESSRTQAPVRMREIGAEVWAVVEPW